MIKGIKKSILIEILKSYKNTHNGRVLLQDLVINACKIYASGQSKNHNITVLVKSFASAHGEIFGLRPKVKSKPCGFGEIKSVFNPTKSDFTCEADFTREVNFTRPQGRI